VGGACSTYGEGRGAYRVLVGRPKGRNHLEDLVIDGRAWTGLIWLRIGTGGRLL
jgi:hypothetical protein